MTFSYSAAASPGIHARVADLGLWLGRVRVCAHMNAMVADLSLSGIIASAAALSFSGISMRTLWWDSAMEVWSGADFDFLNVGD